MKKKMKDEYFSVVKAYESLLAKLDPAPAFFVHWLCSTMWFFGWADFARLFDRSDFWGMFFSFWAFFMACLMLPPLFTVIKRMQEKPK